MRVLLVLIIALLSACNDEEPKFSSEVSFNVPGGSYETLRVKTWEDKSSICASLAIMSGHTETKWLPFVGLVIASEDGKHNAQINLLMRSKDAKDLQLVYRLNVPGEESPPLIVLKEHVALREHLKLDVFFAEDNKMGVRLDGVGKVFALPFVPKFLEVSGSSSQSQIKFSTETCEANAKQSQASSVSVAPQKSEK
jgi:hypothetical protein